MTEVVATIRAFDGNSKRFMSETVYAQTKEEFNERVDNFIAGVPFSRFHITIKSEDSDLTPEQLQIMEDHQVD
jgi:hypothetical protein